ncbi:hypothetical protein [Teichococcus aestuarii]|uniref:hypothetical protein n=1 Tax=Teichococcus aestuarii TaxID=568898 RepID=UPI003611199E
MFVTTEMSKPLKSNELASKFSSALLVCGDLSLAQQAAIEKWGWKNKGQDCFQALDGDKVHAVGDCSVSTFLSWPRGTRVYLGPGWYGRQDSKILNALLYSGHLVEVDPPNSGGR